MVQCSHVSIDLNGYTITGNAGKKRGVYVAESDGSPITGVVVENGCLRATATLVCAQGRSTDGMWVADC